MLSYKNTNVRLGFARCIAFFATLLNLGQSFSNFFKINRCQSQTAAIPGEHFAIDHRYAGVRTDVLYFSNVFC